MRILHIITSLSTGGAEKMLQKVVLALQERNYAASVVSLTSVSTVGAELQLQGVPVQGLGGKGGVLLPRQIRCLLSACRSVKPDIVHSWMYHANVAAQLLLQLSSRGARPSLISSVRGAVHAPEEQKLTLRLVRRLDASLSHRDDAVVFNSRRSATQHAALGYDVTKMKVIPNCFDTTNFRPLATERARVRAELACGDAPLVGLIARFDPLKDHRTFLESARLVLQRYPQCRFLLAGRGCDDGNKVLMGWIHDLGLAHRVYVLGERHDVAAIDNALDIGVSSSASESFPNAIGEAMACAVPCVVTDVGDCDSLVGDTGYVVPPRSAPALAEAILTLVGLSVGARATLGERARKRVISEFSIDRIAEQYAELYEYCGGLVRAQRAALS